MALEVLNAGRTTRLYGCRFHNLLTPFCHDVHPDRPASRELSGTSSSVVKSLRKTGAPRCVPAHTVGQRVLSATRDRPPRGGLPVGPVVVASFGFAVREWRSRRPAAAGRRLHLRVLMTPAAGSNFTCGSTAALHFQAWQLAGPDTEERANPHPAPGAPDRRPGRVKLVSEPGWGLAPPAYTDRVPSLAALAGKAPPSA